MPLPYAFVKSSTIAESEIPAACIFAIFSFAVCDQQPYILHEATVSLQPPHWQASLEPTRKTSTFWFLLAICARAAPPKVSASASATLLLHLNMLFRNPHHFGASVLQLDLARNQRDDRAEDQDRSAHPYPAHQRKYVRLNGGLSVLQ